MKNFFKALFSSMMWWAFMSLTKECLPTWTWYLFGFSGVMFFNILFQLPDQEEK